MRSKLHCPWYIHPFSTRLQSQGGSWFFPLIGLLEKGRSKDLSNLLNSQPFSKALVNSPLQSLPCFWSCFGLLGHALQSIWFDSPLLTSLNLQFAGQTSSQSMMKMHRGDRTACYYSNLQVLPLGCIWADLICNLIQPKWIHLTTNSCSTCINYVSLLSFYKCWQYLVHLSFSGTWP